MERFETNEKEINRIIELFTPRMKNSSRAIIKMFHLEKKSSAQIARLKKLSRQRIHAVLKKFRKSYLEYKIIPDEFKEVKLFVSPEVFKRIKEKPIDIVLVNGNLMIKNQA